MFYSVEFIAVVKGEHTQIITCDQKCSRKRDAEGAKGKLNQ